MIRFSRVLGSTLIYASTASSSRFAGGHIAAAFLIESNAHLSHLQSRSSGTRTTHRSSQPLAMVSSIENATPNATSCLEEANALFPDPQRTIGILPYVDTSHNSATITVPTDDEDGNGAFSAENFSTLLTNTVTILQELEKSSLWVEVPMSKARLIEEIEAADLGFEFHHAQGSTLKLNAWLRKDIPSKVPEFATHHVGVGAVVINSRNEILCIRELRKNYHPWKIPTGLADLGESIHDAAEREVLEETGITASCHSILSFRHTHGMANGRSDLFFVCRLIPKEDDNGSVQTPVPQACEIAEAKWIPLSEYRDMVDGLTEESKGHPVMTFVMNQIFDKGLRINMTEVSSVIPGRRSTPLYFPEAPSIEG
uniref:Nudix hydrolase domain-containing protein n=1 Tax=Pseudo-nitzschia australis TaxID=44445 RepID=A0A7S4AY20_9STRA|mmetsp:Transcript_4906/g.10846  ORF Transcript_4906/g.10846 Transcript_4906/m.10846 type:complete len:369 (+) Transcript_4906:115-1221(+)|eukprot:CAMPEP_0168186218 /NCGR_PEP_ID=MMETSP0139_2-20121125/14302_1 /TAXON_ID=44445 /ORGANISM="Pseudo-nitzschia australis, Strain 10249 10 AB" /LENGTH=368 /DNA_ID=CAMNT_0008108185 /DNA_START=84 /DNA_END=1190 /DNA_ORIENTATION=-